MINKTKLLAVTALLSTTILSADFVRVEAGMDFFNPELNGISSSGNSSLILNNLTGENAYSTDNSNIWLNIKHPIPVIPNLRIDKTSLSLYSNHSKLNSSLSWGGIKFDMDTDVETETNLNSTDFTTYYNFIDNTAWLTLDLGVTFRNFNGDITVSSELMGSAVEEIDDVIIPMAYLRARINVPFSGLGTEIVMKHISYEENKFTDYQATIDYTTKFGLGLELGYREMTLVADTDDLNTDIELKGPFAGLTYRF